MVRADPECQQYGPPVAENLPHDPFLDMRPGLGEHYKPPGVEH